MNLVFTDLDGTLLDANTYSWEPARPALDHLRRQGAPWVMVTSKTRQEVEFWRRDIDNEHPFIVENGGAVFVPRNYFPFPIPAAKHNGSYQVLEWGTPYERLVDDLDRASRTSQCRIHGFHEMTITGLASVCNLPLEQAALAKQREYDEPFLILDPDRAGALAAAIEEQGRQWTRGGRFWHILGDNDKARAVEALIALFERTNRPVRTIGLGDGLNDVPFLNVVDVPVLIRSPQLAELKAMVQHGLVTNSSGPAGWNEAILALTGD